MYLGIDLGTTNSAAVLTTGEQATPVRAADGGVLVPSVVRIDARGNVVVGARARRFLDTDPDNTRGEFKRLMGTGRKLTFAAAKLEKSPEELSALVLAAVRTSAEQTLGYAPRAAVVTVPALFELPQTRATSEAARLAGFERVEHIQEPVASALTAGWKRGDDTAPWLVYDLGGGTFDVSLLETREGVLRVIDHDGDNFLGGRDMDARILEHVLAELEKEHGRPFRRSDPSMAKLLRRLRVACEDAKIELGAGRDAAVSLSEPIAIGDDEIAVDVPISAKKFGELVLPLVDKSIDVCRRLLERQGLASDAIARIVLVGGPTVMPLLRERLDDRLRIALATDVDPMTAVAEGAAYFAREHDLSTSMSTSTTSTAATSAAPAKAAPRTSGGVQVWLQYPGVSGDLYPFVVGRVQPGAVAKVRLERTDGGFKSAEEKVDADGSFVVQAELRARAASTFRISGKTDAGTEVALEPNELTIRHGISLADPPLARTIGIALADGGVAVYFERGAPLPSRKTFRLRTALTVHPGAKESAISVPIVQGEVDVARLCRLVGTIEIRSDALKVVLVAGSVVDVVLELDRGGRLSATAHLPEQGITFPGTLVLVSPEATVAQLDEHLARLRKATETLYGDSALDEVAKKKLVALDTSLDDAATEIDAARGGDPDAIEKVRRLLIDADATISDVEASKIWPDLDAKALECVSLASYWISIHGTTSERRALDEAMRSLQRARAAKNATEFTKRMRNVETLADAAALRDSGLVVRLFHLYAGRIGEMRDPREAQKQIALGNDGLAKNDIAKVRAAMHALFDLLPPEEAERIKAHGSGVQR